MAEHEADADAGNDTCGQHDGGNVDAPVISSTRNDIVSGPPTMATPSVAIPVTMLSRGIDRQVQFQEHQERRKEFPMRLPTNRDAKKRPPRNPDASEIRQAITFKAMTRAIRPVAISWCRSSSIAP